MSIIYVSCGLEIEPEKQTSEGIVGEEVAFVFGLVGDAKVGKPVLEAANLSLTCSEAWVDIPTDLRRANKETLRSTCLASSRGGLVFTCFETLGLAFRHPYKVPVRAMWPRIAARAQQPS
ncbi:uncharacterized protein LOC109704179 isoform X3 [Ananas comosus]|uniref:Uncharacterized protein LOC109704179 isoform X3 n=1 Tax=Ananas comosus TaxID=4615 RepID=A0A6P5EBL5_ANACO|nr:uncharacterized protein LOC109704179 isoform X3 [Ananas comosus]